MNFSRADERLKDGYWVAPVILADVTPGMTLAQEEIFGPIACVMRFSTEDEAIEICNGTAYGLTAAICTTDVARAGQIAQRLEAGMVFINNYMRRAFLGSPFGGVKAAVSAARTRWRRCTSSSARRTSGSRPAAARSRCGRLRIDQPGWAVMSRSDPVNSGCVLSVP
jgi:acyl-CoA reductase-like NAD-dependent aldehyde dehydrogenase